ncbi:hypothetical protein SADUNF_Sadunf08G0075100 [Salix dunnii]|uniref:Uncharacterized protein n=1 Tax=Salix dunnii TaxID=1413687 RepID=A0A835JXE1_9ROSI|nr:hypothetical protein SADUNF_Sadunf08G0075100 [Salix dunnii]
MRRQQQQFIATLPFYAAQSEFSFKLQLQSQPFKSILCENPTIFQSFRKKKLIPLNLIQHLSQPALHTMQNSHYILSRTAKSLRDSLIINRNATYKYYEKKNGRALLSVIGNLGISGAYADALRKLGHELEDMGNPWEIVRNDASYLVKFHGEVVSKLDGSKEWV